MKKIIKGKMYNTETAKDLGTYQNIPNVSDFNYYSETLFLKKTGEYFLYCSGNAASKYSKRCGDNSWCGSSEFIPLSEAEARYWSENHLDIDEYIAIWGEPEE